MTTGVAFKIAAVPFHYWTPDAYQGSPTPVTGYLSVGPKVGAFALILRLFVEALGPLRADWLQVVIVLAVLTMTLGNLVALTQTNVKRMLAYSSIAHTGYMLVGLAAFAAGRIEGLEGLLYYGAAYSVMNLGAFAVVAAIQRRAGVTSGLDTFAGLGRREPWLAILMTLFLLSLTGIPPTAGFFAKAYVILAAVQASEAGWTSLGILAVIAVLNAAAAAFYYLRVVVYMFMREPRSEEAPLTHGRLLWGGLAVAERADGRARAHPRAVPRHRRPGRARHRRVAPSTARRHGGGGASTGERTDVREPTRAAPTHAGRSAPSTRRPSAPGSFARVPAVNTVWTRLRLRLLPALLTALGRRPARERADVVHDRRRAAARGPAARLVRAPADPSTRDHPARRRAEPPSRASRRTRRDPDRDPAPGDRPAGHAPDRRIRRLPAVRRGAVPAVLGQPRQGGRPTSTPTPETACSCRCSTASRSTTARGCSA